MAERNIPFHIPLIEEDEIAEVVDTLRSGWITTGPKTNQFEEKFAEYIGAKHAVAVNSCTAAMHLVLEAADIAPGDEVITTPYAFAASSEVILYTGARPVFVDIDEQTLCIDPDNIKGAITKNTRAILPVHIAGYPCDMESIMAIAKEHNLFVLEDAAHAIESVAQGKKIGTIGHATAFSFYATKNLTTGEGGMITTDDPELADKMRVLSLHGLSRDAWKRYTSEGSWYYEIIFQGYKYNMSDIMAALGIHQLKKIDRLLEIRRHYVDIYQTAFQPIEAAITPVPEKENDVSAWHLYLLRADHNKTSLTRNECIQYLKKRGINTSVHFIPIHLHPFYKEKFGYKDDDFPIAKKVFSEIISLPLYPKMTQEDVEYVADVVVEMLENHKV